MQELKDKLGDFSSEDVNLHLLIRNENTKEYSVLTTELNVTIRNELINNTKSMFDSILGRDYIIEEYSAINKYDAHTIETKNTAQIPILQDINRIMNDDLDYYRSSRIDDDDRIWAFIVVMGNNEMTMFQRCQPKKFLKPDKALRIKELDNGHFSNFEDTILTIDPQMDCISYDERMYIFKKFPFEEIFGVIDELIENVTTKLSDIPQDGLLVDLDEFFDFCSKDKYKIKTLSKVLDDDGFEYLTEGNITQLNESHNLDLEIVEGKIKLTPENTRKILKIMNQDCVNSTLSREPYISHSKSPVRR